jgi:hypothetical protein
MRFRAGIIRNFDTKVFEVIVLLQRQDSLLRPAMTTGINILVDSIPGCLQVPLEAIQVDSISYVFKQTRNGFVRQEVVTGPSNDMNICIAAGLEEGDIVSMSVPAQGEKLRLISLDPQKKEEVTARLADELATRTKAQQEVAKTIKMEDAQSQDNSGSVYIVF